MDQMGSDVVVDTSAIVAIMMQEPDHEPLLEAIAEARSAVVGAPTVVEAGLVLSARLQQDARPGIDGLFRTLSVEVVPSSVDQARAAVQA